MYLSRVHKILWQPADMRSARSGHRVFKARLSAIEERVNQPVPLIFNKFILVPVVRNARE